MVFQAPRIIATKVKRGRVLVWRATERDKLERKLGDRFDQIVSSYEQDLLTKLKTEGRKIITYLKDNYITDEQRESTAPHPEDKLYKATGALRRSLKATAFVEKGKKTYTLTVKSEARGALAKYVKRHIDPDTSDTVLRGEIPIPFDNAIRSFRLSSGKIASPSEARGAFGVKFFKVTPKIKSKNVLYFLAQKRVRRVASTGRRKENVFEAFYVVKSSVKIPRKVDLEEKTEEAVLALGTDKRIREIRASLSRRLRKRK